MRTALVTTFLGLSTLTGSMPDLTVIDSGSAIASPVAVVADSPSLADGHVGADRELIEWAVGRYEQIGVELPPL